jgi:phosphatidylinositol-bisphosphatase
MKAIKAAIAREQELSEDHEFWIKSIPAIPQSPQSGRGGNARGQRKQAGRQPRLGTDQELPNGRLLDREAAGYIRKEFIKQRLREWESTFATYSGATVLCGSFNVNGKKDVEEDLSSWLGWRQDPDIIAVGFQELVDLNAVNVAVSDNKSQQSAQQWRLHIEQFLATRPTQYSYVKHRVLVGVVLFLFCKERHMGALRDLQVATAMTGFGGALGNKGGVSIRFSFYDTTLCFVCSHLAAHRGNVSGRNADYWSIVNKTAFDGDQETAVSWEIRGLNGEFAPLNAGGASNSGRVGLLDHDIVFWIGDLNYRIHERVPVEEVFKRLKIPDGKGLEFLRSMDQLNMERALESAFGGFCEGSLDFMPTYKYQAGTQRYEQRPEKKVRAPAWCDRVLWRSANPSHVQLASYDRAELLLSDHKPVAAVMHVQVRRVNPEKHMEVYRGVTDDLHKWEVQGQSSAPDIKLGSHEVDLGTVRYMHKVTAKLKVANVGRAVAYLRFTEKPQEVEMWPSWLSVEPTFCLLKPGYSHEFSISATIDRQMAQEIAAGRLSLDHLLVLRVENGPELYVHVKGIFAQSAFGVPLEALARRSGGVLGIPRDIWMLVQGIISGGGLDDPAIAGGLFTTPGNMEEVVAIREALGLGQDGEGYGSDQQLLPAASAAALADVLLSLFRSLPVALVPPAVVSRVAGRMAYPGTGGESLLSGLVQTLVATLTPVCHNTFLYLMCFLRRVLEASGGEHLRGRGIAGSVSSALCFGGADEEWQAQEICQDLVMWFLTNYAC